MLLETFIKGIEVLDKTEIKEPTHSSLIIGFIIGLILIIIISCLTKGSIAGMFLGAIVFVVCCVGAMVLSVHPTGEYKYKVTITDEVSLNEFYEKYEITNQEGKIYTIRFKE